MAETPGTPVVINTPPVDAAAHNAEIAAKLAAQDAAGKSTVMKPGEFEEASTALDKLVQAAAPDPNAEAAAKKAAEDAAAAEAAKKAAEQTPEAKKAAEDAAAAETAKKAAEDAAAKVAAEHFKEVPDLPEGTSTKAKDSFNAIKVQAARDISERDTKIELLNKQLAQIQEAAKNPTPEQLAKDKELETLRTHLAKLDVEFDPKFKEFDTKVKAIEDYVYSELKKNPIISDEIITEIKKFGLGGVNLAKLFDAMNDPATQRIVESKIADVRMLQYQKEQALKSTKDNVQQYLAERQKAFQDGVEGHTKATEGYLNNFLGALEWMKDKVADSKDTAATAAAKEHNDLLVQIKRDVADAMRDDSPQMRATLLTGYANMCRLQHETKAQATQIEVLSKQLKEATTKLDAIKNSATSRLRETGAPPGGKLPAAPAANQFTTPAATALDNIAKQVMEERQAKGV